ncbi:MAG: beta-galactosidase, partial [Chloroflexi bacterium]|nr:beta-galactosidase [Chloroflexota bacterium]
MKRLFAALTCLMLLTSMIAPSGILAPSRVAEAAPVETSTLAPADPRFFAETGYRVGDDAFWDYFNKRGGLRTFGYPVSRKFTLLGYDVQFFQRRIMQKQANGSVSLLNILDPELMPYTSINGATIPASDPGLTNQLPAPGSPDYSQKVLDYVKANSPNTWQNNNVNFYRTFMDTVKYEEAYPNRDGDPNWMAGINLEMWGAPTSAPTVDPNNNDFVYLRFQRGVLHYDKKTGLTQGLLLADYLKSIITGQNPPGDPDPAAKSSQFYKQYNNGAANSLNRPNDLPNTNMKDAFEPESPATPVAGPPPAAPSTPPSATSGLRYGMQAHLFDQDQPRVLNALTGTGFDWVKQQVRWETIEGSKGSFNWGGLDSIVGNAQARGVKILFSITAAPKWATGGSPV